MSAAVYALPAILDGKQLFVSAGLPLALFIVFAETGLLLGFFLPGDSLLFTAGLISAGGAVLGGTPIDAFAPLWVLLVTVPVAAVAGDQLGYLIGRKAGPAVFTRDDTRLFKRRYVIEAHEFFDKHGTKAIILARFVPIVRTFMPVTAGVAQMPYRTYLPFDVLGGVTWGAGVTTLGYFLGQIDFVAQHIEVILLLIVAVSVVPILAQVIRSRAAGRSARRTAGRTSGPTA